MKKWLLVLGMITCLAATSACGNTVAEGSDQLMETAVTQDQVNEYVTNTVSSLNQIVAEGAVAQYESNGVVYTALTSWESALKEMGDYRSVDACTFVQNEDGMTINVDITGTQRNATMEIILDADMNLSSVTTTVKYTMGDLMSKAGLNTLLGMGTVFVVLILISLIISCFNFIPKIQAAFSGKKKAEASVDKAVAQIVGNEAVAQDDDLELVAVISAAIAAYEGSASSDGYVVRSIRKVR